MLLPPFLVVDWKGDAVDSACEATRWEPEAEDHQSPH